MPYLKPISNIYDIFNKLEKFMLSNDYIDLLLNNNNKFNEFKLNKHTLQSQNQTQNNIKYVENNVEKINKQEINKKINNEYIFLNDKDSDKKFWYFYMFVNNYELSDLPSDYEKFKFKTETKIKLVEELSKADNSIFKQYKVSRKNIQSSLSDIKNNILLEDLIGLSILYKRNIIYICDNMYYELGAGLTSDNNEWDIILKDEDKIEKIPINKKKEELYNKIREGNNYFKIDNITKPIKSISSFTVEQLANIATKLNISIEKDNNKKKLKKEIYDEILLKLNNFK